MATQSKPMALRQTLARRIVRLSTRNRWLYTLLLHRRSRSGDPVLVYTMGKVGSTALLDAVRVATGREVIHVHRVTREGIDTARAFRKQYGYRGQPIPDWRGEYVRWRVEHDQRDRPWDVLVGVREPIGHSISTFFQVAEEYKILNSSVPAQEVDLDSLTDRFLTFHRQRPLPDWFSDEFFVATGIDVYEKAFPRYAGSDTYENERFRVLLIRYEDLRRVAPTALGNFLGLDEPVVLHERNIGAEKAYAQVYKRFLQDVQLPEWLISAAYDSKQARHFYSLAEIETFRSKWIRAGSA